MVGLAELGLQGLGSEVSHEPSVKAALWLCLGDLGFVCCQPQVKPSLSTSVHLIHGFQELEIANMENIHWIMWRKHFIHRFPSPLHDINLLRLERLMCTNYWDTHNCHISSPFFSGLCVCLCVSDPTVLRTCPWSWGGGGSGGRDHI